MFLGVGAILQMWVTSSYIQIWLWPGLVILGDRVYNFVARASREKCKRSAIPLGHKSFYWFGIRSSLAASPIQILKTPFSMRSSCILGFQATRPLTRAYFIYPLFTVRWRIALSNGKVFLRQITAGCKHIGVRAIFCQKGR